MNVREIMTINPVCATQDTSLEEVARMMVENDCGQIPVVEERLALAGVRLAAALNEALTAAPPQS